MLVVEIDGSDPSIIVDSDGLDATGAFANLNSLLFFASAGVPGEDSRRRASLSGNSSLAAGIDTNAQNIICVMVHIISDILGRAVDLTATEKLLSVSGDASQIHLELVDNLGVQNDTEGGGVVDGMTSGVPV